MTHIPLPEPGGFIKTLNNMGYMTSTLDPVSREFVKFAGAQTLPVLDVGAAYGIATREALLQGATVLANDLDPRHLELLESAVPTSERSRLTKLPGDFRTLSIPKASLAGILVSRVLHFFEGDEIEKSATQMASWLARQGRVFVVAETPFLKNFSSFIPEYERRRTLGFRWPGFVTPVSDYAPERAAFLPNQIHLLDPDVLMRSFEAAGFKTLWCATLNRKDFPIDLQLDGRESVGYIGEK